MAGSVPEKLQSLRGSSLARRIEAERRRNLPRQRIVQSKPKLSKYRRKCANAKERERMSKVNEMFDKLKTIVPEGLNKEQEDKETKVTTLRSAILYINELQQLLTDYDAGSLDITRYQDLDHEKENKKKSKKTQKVIKMSKHGVQKKKNSVVKRKTVLKPKWIDHTKSSSVAKKVVAKKPVLQSDKQPLLNRPCDIPPTVSQDYVVYRPDPPVEYVIYESPQQPEPAAIQPSATPAQRDYVVYTEREPAIVPQDAGKDYVIYRGGEEGDQTPKDVNVISLYISLIDGKRNFDGKFAPEL